MIRSALGFDLGRHAAWAWVSRPKVGPQKTETGRIELAEISGGAAAEMAHFRRMVGLLMDCKPEAIAYERPGFNVGMGGIWIVRQEGVLLAEAGARGVFVADVAVPTLKKWATGSGKAEKHDMLAAAEAAGWLPPGNYRGRDDEVDAVCVVRWLLAHAEEAT